DVDGADDVVEEVARIYGYDKIPTKLIADALPTLNGNTDLDREERVREILSSEELQEIITYSLTNAEREARIFLLTGSEQATNNGAGTGWGDRPYLLIENPISPDRNVMRQMLLPGMLDIVARNWRQRERVALYEIGPVYLQVRDDETDLTIALPEDKGLRLPLEPRRLAFTLWGASEPANWRNKTQGAMMDFYDLKGVLEALLEGLHLDDRATFAPGAHPSFHPGRAAILKLDGRAVGTFGELHPLVRARFDLPDQAVLVGEFDLDAILSMTPDRYIVRPLSTYPVVKEDLALIIDEAIPAQRVTELIRQTGGSILSRLDLFDVYRGEQIATGKKSLAYALIFQSFDQVLTDSEVAKLREKIIQRAKRELGAELRGGSKG
ncbi:MAG TPA: phenylalanine--tRNA ligase subunit beta, partial [Anaerolineae bacterium]